MRTMTKYLVGSLAVLVMLSCTHAQAALVRVEFDSFTTSAADTMPGFGFTIARTLTPNSGVFSFDNVNGTLTLNNGSSATLSYVVTGGIFGDVFATSGFNASFFDGFAANAAYNVGKGQTSLSITVDGIPQVVNVNLDNGFNDFHNIALSSATQVSFTFANTRPAAAPPGTLVINGLSAISLNAVPEPSALLLVGSVLGIGLIRRRR